MVDFSIRLKQLRTDKGLTQNQVAARVGISKAMISAYETDIRLPSYDVLIKLSNLFGVTTDYLLCRTDKRYIDISGLTDDEAAAVSQMVALLTSKKAVV